MPAPMRALWYLSWLDFEVAQGSLIAYFENSHGRHARDALAALRRIGADRTAEVVALAAEAVHAGAWEELDELTDRYRDAADREDWGARLDAYLTSEAHTLIGWGDQPEGPPLDS